MAKTIKKQGKRIYLDNAATTKVDADVVKAMLPYFDEKYGNASSLHQFGQEARDAIDDARKIIARSINAEFDEIIFTSGGTESNNAAIKSVALTALKQNKINHMITTKIEHPSVFNVCEWLKDYGISTSYLNVDQYGFIDIKQLDALLKEKKTSIVSVIHGNNEIGTVQDIAAISNIVHRHGALLHIDACQSYLKIPIDVKKIKIDLITLNAHKIHGPKGIGALYVSRSARKLFREWQHGGSHEFNLRAGTENVALITGFATAVQTGLKTDHAKIKKLRDYLYDSIAKNIPEIKLNGPLLNDASRRLCNNLNVSFRSVEGESILLQLDLANIAVSTGSACSSQSLEPSHVLTAIGLKPEIAHSSIRFSLSKYNTKDEIDSVIVVLKRIIGDLRKISPFWKNNR